MYSILYNTKKEPEFGENKEFLEQLVRKGKIRRIEKLEDIAEGDVILDAVYENYEYPSDFRVYQVSELLEGEVYPEEYLPENKDFIIFHTRDEDGDLNSGYLVFVPSKTGMFEREVIIEAWSLEGTYEKNAVIITGDGVKSGGVYKALKPSKFISKHYVENLLNI